MFAWYADRSAFPEFVERLGAVAALACRRYFNFDKASPCHYGSFPIIDQTAEKFVEWLKFASTEAVVPKVGETISL